MMMQSQNAQFEVSLSLDAVGDEHDEAVQHALEQSPHATSASSSAAMKESLTSNTNTTISDSPRIKGGILKIPNQRENHDRGVVFCDKGHSCEYFDMYDEEWHPDLWFAPEDYEDMKAGFEFTIFMMDAGCPEKVEDDDTTTTRGLEKRTEEGQWRRYERKRDYYNQVLDEQERQWDEDQDDHDKIGQIAVQCTRISFTEAYDIGVLDEIAVHGHSLRDSTRERQQQIQNDIASGSDTNNDFDASSKTNGDADANSLVDLQKEDTCSDDTLTASTVSDCSSNFSEP